MPFLQNSDMFWKPTLAIQGDAATLISQLSENLRGYKCDPEWLATLQQRDIDKENANK